MSPALPRERAVRIRLVVLDVDGVLTDGGMFMGATADGRAVEMKRFEITDQLGIRMLAWAGIRVVFVSGRLSPANRLRAEELDVRCFEGGGGHKLPILAGLLAEERIGWEETACICDDLADIPIFRRAGLAVAVANAVPEVRAIAHWVTKRSGGAGAVREFAETLLRTRGEWDAQVARYLRERDPEYPA